VQYLILLKEYALVDLLYLCYAQIIQYHMLEDVNVTIKIIMTDMDVSQVFFNINIVCNDGYFGMQGVCVSCPRNCLVCIYSN
jgi:hypothetical protein